MGEPNTVPGQLIDTSGAPPYVPPPGSPPLMTGATPVAPPPAPIVYTDLGRGQAQADFAAASSGSGWEFDAEAMDKVIKSLEDSASGDFRDAQSEAQAYTYVKPPGDEVASQGYVDAVVASGRAYNDSIQGVIDYTVAYVETLKKIRTAYQQQDQATIDALRGNSKDL